MSSLGSWLWGSTQVDEAIDKATSELLPSGAEDIALNLEICDQIRSKAVQPKDAMRALKRRLNHKNPNVQLLALSLTDICIKNGGDHFLAEVAGREFVDNLVSILKIPALNLEVKNKILRLVQNWAVAFEGKPALGYVGQVYKTLKSEGFTFPPQDLAVANAAMVDTQTAPEWIDSDVCLRCRTQFSFTNRKHHCRNCGQVFDQQCSSKVMPLPHFGIPQEVRVCDGCHVKLTKNKKERSRSLDSKPHVHTTGRHRSGRDLADQELQRAIEASLRESSAAGGSGHARPGYVPAQPSPSTYAWQSSEPPLVDHATRPPAAAAAADDDDPELRAAIEASLREANAPRASAPAPAETPRSEEPDYAYGQGYPPAAAAPSLPALPNYDLQPLESDAILTFSQAVQHVEAEGGRDMTRYPAVNELFDKANGLRPKLAMSLDDTDRKEKMLSEMHEKLSSAVKLYDKLLTEQLSRPAWRSSAASTSQPQQYGSPRYNTVDGSYGQWTPQQTPAAASPPPHAQAQPQQQFSYGATPQAQYAQPPAQYAQPPAQYAQSPVSDRSFQQQQQQQQQQQPQQYGNQPATTVPQWSQPPYRDPQNQQYAQPLPASSSSVPRPATQYNPPPVPQATFQQPPPTPMSLPQSPSVQPVHYALSPPAQQIQSPPPDHIYQYAPPTQYQGPEPPVASPAQPPTLSRHNTVSYASPPPSTSFAQNANSFSPPPRQSQPTQGQVPHSMPHFPVAPTSTPQSFALYGSGAPVSGVEQTERKEALLIDL